MIAMVRKFFVGNCYLRSYERSKSASKLGEHIKPGSCEVPCGLLILYYNENRVNAAPTLRNCASEILTWRIRKGQLEQGAMQEPRPGQSVCMITDIPKPGKYEEVSDSSRPLSRHENACPANNKKPRLRHEILVRRPRQQYEIDYIVCRINDPTILM